MDTKQAIEDGISAAVNYEPLMHPQVGMFTAVSVMNEAFGNPKGDAADLYHPGESVLGGPNLTKAFTSYHNSWEALEQQCKNIQSEVNELTVALANRDLDSPKGVRDALCDIMVFALGAFHIAGVDADEDMKEVVGKVMTRFCSTPDQFMKTMNMYQKKGLDVYAEGEFPRVAIKSALDQQMPEYPKGKFLKSVGYSKPVFKTYTPQVAEFKTEAKLPQETHIQVTPMKYVTEEQIKTMMNNPPQRFDPEAEAAKLATLHKPLQTNTAPVNPPVVIDKQHWDAFCNTEVETLRAELAKLAPELQQLLLTGSRKLQLNVIKT